MENSYLHCLLSCEDAADGNLIENEETFYYPEISEDFFLQQSDFVGRDRSFSWASNEIRDRAFSWGESELDFLIPFENLKQSQSNYRGKSSRKLDLINLKSNNSDEIEIKLENRNDFKIAEKKVELDNIKKESCLPALDPHTALDTPLIGAQVSLPELKELTAIKSPPVLVMGVYSKEQRQERINIFRAKKKRRVWKKQIKYDCRKRLADNRPRVKGRFVSRVEGEDTIQVEKMQMDIDNNTIKTEQKIKKGLKGKK